MTRGHACSLVKSVPCTLWPGTCSGTCRAATKAASQTSPGLSFQGKGHRGEEKVGIYWWSSDSEPGSGTAPTTLLERATPCFHAKPREWSSPTHWEERRAPRLDGDWGSSELHGMGRAEAGLRAGQMGPSPMRVPWASTTDHHQRFSGSQRQGSRCGQGHAPRDPQGVSAFLRVWLCTLITASTFPATPLLSVASVRMLVIGWGHPVLQTYTLAPYAKTLFSNQTMGLDTRVPSKLLLMRMCRAVRWSDHEN